MITKSQTIPDYVSINVKRKKNESIKDAINYIKDGGSSVEFTGNDCFHLEYARFLISALDATSIVGVYEKSGAQTSHRGVYSEDDKIVLFRK